MSRSRGWLRTTVIGLVPLGVAVTAMAASAYGLMQQGLRAGANDPLVAMAEDASKKLDGGLTPAGAVPPDRVEATRSLDTFLMVFDSGGRLVASSATVDGGSPDYPAGVLAGLQPGGEASPTWQPRPGVRIATVALRYRGGFVVAGRSLRVVEARIDQLGQLAVILWLVALATTAVGCALAGWINMRWPRP